MHSYLEREGFQLLEAGSAEEAEVDRHGVSPADPYLVADVIRPGRSATELSHRLAVRQPDIKGLFVSGYRHDAIDQFCGPGC